MIAEAFVRMRPDFSGFRTEAAAGVTAALAGLETSAAAGLGAVAAATAPVTAGLTSIERSALAAAGVTSASTRQMASGLLAVEAQALKTSAAVSQVGPAAAAGAAGGQAALLGVGRGALRATAGMIGITSAATGAAIALKGMVDITAQTEEELNVLQEVTGATGTEMDRISDLATELGADLTLPGVSAADAAAAMNELAKAGLSIQDVMGGAKGALQLATAGEIDVAQAAALAGSALNVFSLEGTRASDVADLLAGASVAAQGSVGDMALALQQSGAVARQAGLSVEQTVGAIALLAKNGLLGSDAGTSLRTTLLRLIPTTEEARKFVDALGVSIDENRTLGEQLPEVIEQYRSALARLNPTLQQQALTQIFGTDAIRAASIFAREGADGLDEMTRAANRQSAAAELAEARTRGLGGSFGNLGSQIETLGLELGELASPGIQLVVDGFADFTGELTEFVQEAKTVPGQIQEIATEVADLAVGFKDAIEEIGGFDFPDPELPDLPDLPDPVEGLIDLVPLKAQADQIGDILRAPIDEIQDRSIRSLPIIGPLANLIDTAERAKSAVAAVGEATGTFDITPIRSLRDEMEDLRAPDVIDRADVLAQEGGDARRAGGALGQQIGEGLVEGIEDTSVDAVTAARRNIREVARQGREAVAEAIRQAQANLAGLGRDLAGQAAVIIDSSGAQDRIEQLEAELSATASREQRSRLREAVTEATENLRAALAAAPIERQIQALQARLDRQQGRGQRTDLQRTLRDAREALADAEEQAQTAGPLTRRQVGARTEFLRPFREAVADARRDISEFNTQTSIEQLQARLDRQTDEGADNISRLTDALREARAAVVASQREFATRGLINSLQEAAEEQKRTVEQGVDNAIQAFNDGLITLPQLNERIARTLAANDVDYRRAGGRLGRAFVRQFESSLAGLSEQAKAILAGPQRPGAGLESDVVRPTDAQQRAGAANVQARADLNQALLDQGNDTNEILRQIRDEQRIVRRANATTAATVAQRGNAPTGRRP